MANEWFDLAWINFTKAILHGQMIATDGREIEIEQVLTDAQREQVYALNAKHEAATMRLLRSFAEQSA